MSDEAEQGNRFKVGDRVYPRDGGEVVEVVEVWMTINDSPRRGRQQFRARAASGSGLCRMSDDYTLAPPRASLPDPTVTGPCQVQATFMCTDQAAGERLIPTSMLPDALIPGPFYAPMCLPCYEHLSTVYLATLHRGDQS